MQARQKVRKKGFYFNIVIVTRGAVIRNNLQTINAERWRGGGGGPLSRADEDWT